MKPVQVITLDGSGGCEHSGLTGPADIPDPPREPRQAGLRPRLAKLARSGQEVWAGLTRVRSLTWEAGRRLTIGLAVTTVLAGLVPAGTAYIIRILINTVARAFVIQHAHRPDRIPLPLPALHGISVTTEQAIGVLVAVQFLVFAAASLITALGQACQQLLQDRLTLLIQVRVMRKASELDLAFFEDSNSYDLLRQADGEATVRPITMITSAFGIVQAAITFAGLMGLLATLNPVLAGLALIAPVPAFLADARYGQHGFRLAIWTSPIRRRMDYLSRLVTTDSYAKEVKLYGVAPYLVTRFRLLGEAFYLRQRRLVMTRQLAVPAWGMVSTIAVGAIYAYVAFGAASGRLTIGDLGLYAAAAASLQSAVQTFFQGLSGMYENNLYLNTLYQLLACRASIAAPPSPKPLPKRVLGHIVLDHVTFRYPGASRSALTDVCLEIDSGQTVAIVGRNGAGKSTLVKLLCRLYDPDSGRVLLDGIDIRDIAPDELRSRVAALFQDFISYQATASENIGLGDVTRLGDRGLIEAAGVKAGAGDLLAGLAGGYDTPLGAWFDRGVNLSGGEWQKVALARAFFRDAPLLILDEPTSALDARAEHELFGTLRDLADGRTTIYISHRFSTVFNADRIVLLEDGQLTEQGTHAELMARGGMYSELFSLQAEPYLAAAQLAQPGLHGHGSFDQT